MHALTVVLAAAFPALVVWCALRDATSMTIPNKLTIAVAAAFFPAALAAGLPPAAWGLALATGLGCLVFGMAMFAFGWVGGGDAKLFAACGLWLGVSAATPFVFWTGVAGGVLAGGLVLAREMQKWLPQFGPTWMQRLLTRGEGVPYGVAIAAGALAAFPASPVMKAALGA